MRIRIHCTEMVGQREIIFDNRPDAPDCTVPTMEFVASISPGTQVTDGANVLVTCESGYNYGNTGTKNIVCSSSTNNFPASCRSE